MNTNHLIRVASVTVLFLLGLTLASTVDARVEPPEGSIPGAKAKQTNCMANVSIEPLGSAMPEDANGQVLVSLRVTFGPDGGFEAHTHPGTLVVTLVSGHVDFTQIDDHNMVLNRAPGENSAGTTEVFVPGEPLTLAPGDWLEEPLGMVHTAWNNSSEPAVVMVAGLVDPDQPFVQCVDAN